MYQSILHAPFCLHLEFVIQKQNGDNVIKLWQH